MSQPSAVAAVRPDRPLRNPVVPLVAVGYVLLAVTAAALVLTVAVDRGDGVVVVTAEVIATGGGDGDQIVAVWPDHRGELWETTLTPRDPEAVAKGGTVEIRFHPEAREQAYTTDRSFHEARGDVDAATAVPVVALLLAVPLLWAWTWRLGRWALGALRSPEPATVQVLVATPHLGSQGFEPEPAALWLRLRLPDGETRYQKALWNRRLLADTLRRSAEAPRVFGSDADRGSANGAVRRCPGLRRMYVVDIPGVGRIWPATTARPRRPRTHWLDEVDPGRSGEQFRDGSAPAMLTVLGLLLVGYVWWHGGVVTAAAVPVVVGSLWLWLGATPIRGVYASRPDPDRM